jgi:hypothetical protein
MTRDAWGVLDSAGLGQRASEYGFALRGETCNALDDNLVSNPSVFCIWSNKPQKAQPGGALLRPS